MTDTQTVEEWPRGWFGSLGSYNAGRLVGEWFDLSADADEIWEAIRDVMKRGEGDEWFMADCEYLPGFLRGENPNIETLAEYVEGLEKADTDGMPGFLYLAICDHYEKIVDTSGDLTWFGDGEIRDYSDLALAWVEQMGSLGEALGCGEVPDELERYFDWDAYGREMAWDYPIIEGYAVRAD